MNQSYLKIGVIGGIDPIDEDAVRRLLEHSLNKAMSNLARNQIEIIPRFATAGISVIARAVAEKRGYGILDVESLEEGMRVDPAVLRGIGLDHESAAFLDYVDVIIRIGGGKQARLEADIFEEWGGKVYQCDFISPSSHS